MLAAPIFIAECDKKAVTHFSAFLAYSALNALDFQSAALASPVCAVSGP
jgi:hypothetical protein